MSGSLWSKDEDALLMEERAGPKMGWSIRASARIGRSPQACMHRVEHFEDRKRLEAEDPMPAFLPWNLVVIPEHEHLARINERGGFPRFAMCDGLMTPELVTAEGRVWNRSNA